MRGPGCLRNQMVVLEPALRAFPMGSPSRDATARPGTAAERRGLAGNAAGRLRYLSSKLRHSQQFPSEEGCVRTGARCEK